MATLDDFMGRNEVDETLFYSNWFTAWYNACLKAGLDPEEVSKKEYSKRRRKRK